MNNNFLNLHILTTTSIANQNRDYTGAPKQVSYGGFTRLRFSSQAMTRAKRVAYELSTGGDQVTWRAKSGMIECAMTMAADLADQQGNSLDDGEKTSLHQLLNTAVTGLVVNREKAQKATLKRAQDTASRNAKEAPEGATEGATVSETPVPESGDTDGKKDTLVWLAEHELKQVVIQSLQVLRDGASVTDFVNKEGRTQSLSIAAFGRMFAYRPDLQNEAAVQRSHAFTTHAGDIEPDYFTAVNDIPLASDGSGAGHLDINQFGGGVFYWHANIDRAQLWDTWIAGTDEALIRSRLTAFFDALFLALPSGKQATTAPKTVPDAVLIVSASSPVALHQAFESPVKATGEGYRAGSLDALLDAHDRVRKFTPRQFGATAHLASTMNVTSSAHITAEESLDALVEICVDWVLAGRPQHA